MAEAEELIKKLRTERYGGEGYADAIKKLAFEGDKAVVPLSNALKDKGQPPEVRRGAALVFVRMAQEGRLGGIPQESREVMVDALLHGLADKEFGIDKECAFTLSAGGLINSVPKLKDRAVKELISRREELGEWTFRVLREIDYSGISQETREQSIEALNKVIDKNKGKPDFDSEVRAAQKIIKEIEKGRGVSVEPAEKTLKKALEKKNVNV